MVEEARNTGAPVGLPVVQLGVGTVGLELAELVRDSDGSSAEAKGYGYVGLADSSGLARDRGGLSGSYLERALEEKRNGGRLVDVDPGRVGDLDRVEYLFESFDGGILVDVTDARGMEEIYGKALGNDWSVVLANKIPLTEMDSGRFDRVREAGLRYEATVGAGLPVISSLEGLVRGGDELKEIRAILSGSLSYILSRLEEGHGLEEAVTEARQKGYTEPNPVEDLIGNDVHRKALILSRTMGNSVSLDDIEVSPLVPLEEREYGREELREKLKEFNPELESRLESAREAGGRLRYVARVGQDFASVGLEEVEKASPLARGPGTANVIEIESENYESPSLVIQGPGAGPKVTAGGVFSEMNLLVETGQARTT